MGRLYKNGFYGCNAGNWMDLIDLAQSWLVVSKLGEALRYQSEEKKNLGYVNMLYDTRLPKL